MVGGELLSRVKFPTESSDLNVAVSGGADSTALLYLACLTGRPVNCYYVDHKLNSASKEWGTSVSQLAQRFGARFFFLEISVKIGPNLEARLRQSRYAALPKNVLTGHTMDDRAETFLINLLRGSGSAGLSAMKANSRPLLSIRRSETLKLCEELGIEPIKDPSNADLSFMRNRVRLELIPLMNAISKRDIVPIIDRCIQILEKENAYLEKTVDDLPELTVENYNDYDEVLVYRKIRRALVNSEGYPPSNAEIIRVLGVLRGLSRATELAGGRRVEIKNKHLIIKE